MATFVHLTSEKNAKSILRNGISRLRKQQQRPHGIFAMPVTRNFYISHQWLRELKRRAGNTIVGIYFRIPDNEMVWVGHYHQGHRQMTAVEAAGLLSSGESREGFEVIIPRRIDRGEVLRIRSLPQVTGWRYYPGAHGKRPCVCRFCLRGEYGAQRLRERNERQI